MTFQPAKHLPHLRPFEFRGPGLTWVGPGPAGPTRRKGSGSRLRGHTRLSLARWTRETISR